MKDLVTVRKFEEKDAQEVSDLICRNFREVNVRDYGHCAMMEMSSTHNAEWVSGVAGYAHMYLFCIEDKIIGCGSIASFWGSPDESIILTVFVLPEYHRQGIGRKIMETLEQDELYTRARRIEIPASITACEFYKRFGYNYKNGFDELDEEGHYRLEKWRHRSMPLL